MNVAILLFLSLIMMILMMFVDQNRLPSDLIEGVDLLEKREEIKIEVGEIKLTTIEGDSFLLNEMKNKIILINFWASWCPPCKVELPYLFNFADQNQQNVLLILISLDQKKSDIEKALKNMPNLKNIKVVHDQDKQMSHQKFNIFRLPETLVVDDNGIIAFKIIGHEDWVDGQAQSKIKKLFKEMGSDERK